jgi:hypothetical protein
VDEYFDHLIDGHELTKDNPIFRVRQKLSGLKDIGRKAKQYLSQTQQAAWIIMGWNVWITGQPAPATQGWPIHRAQNVLPRIDRVERADAHTD